MLRFLNLLRVKLIGRDKLARLLKDYGLQVFRRKRRYPKTTYSGHNYAVQPNLAENIEVTEPNQLWVADITYIPTRNGHAYLFLITDAYTRMVVGYHLAKTLAHEGAIKALNHALKYVDEPDGIVHHSDRGVQYCCHNFIDEIQKWSLRLSMTDRDHCAQNALAECINGILKYEFHLDREFVDFEQADKAVEDAIFSYNHLRVHGKLSGKTPAEVYTGSDQAFKLWAREVSQFVIPTPPQTFTQPPQHY